MIATYVMRGIEPDEIDRYLPRVLAVTPAEAQARGGGAAAPEGATMVIVGEASQFVERLRAASMRDVTVIPLAELNLDSATLRAPRPN